MKIVAIIPARMAATRFPNKPLAAICGIPMLGHILKRAQRCELFDSIYVATPDEEIMRYVKSIGGNAVLTAHSHERCTDRTAEALEKIEASENKVFDIVAMVQGDEPLVVPQIFTLAIQQLKNNPDLPIVNIVGEIKNKEEFLSPNTVKVVMDSDQNAIYFSREPIPSEKKYSDSYKKYKQTGLIFFRRKALIDFNLLKPTLLEKIESVDMLRLIENRKSIKLVITENDCYGVDIPSDIEKVEKLMKLDSHYQDYKKEFNL